MNKFYKGIIFVFTLLSFVSCDKNDDITIKSESKQITTFAIEASIGEVKAIIDDFNVSITVPKDFDISSLTPKITISAEAEIFPSPDMAQDFTNPVDYTVIAEDGTKQVYIVTVIIEKEPEATIEPLTTLNYSIGDKISIKGTNFSKCQVYIKTNKGNITMSLDSETTTEVTFTLPVNSQIQLGEYDLLMSVRDKKFKIGTINILPFVIEKKE